MTFLLTRLLPLAGVLAALVFIGAAAGFGAAWILKQTDLLRPPVQTRLGPGSRAPYYHFRQPSPR